MNKLAYVIYSQKEANRKIWNYLMDKYELLKKKSIVLAYLWLPIACIVFGIVAVVSWISSLILFRKKVRFTPHYLRACIETANMSQEQTIAFLDDEFSVYKNKLSYGNIASAKQKQIEAAFDILYKQYKFPESDKQITILVKYCNEIPVFNVDVIIPRWQNGASKKYCFVEFDKRLSANNALNSSDPIFISGKEIRIKEVGKLK